MSARLDSSIPSPAPLGTIVTWTATASGANSANLWYRFRARYVGPALAGCPTGGGVPFRDRCAGTGFRVVRDYSPERTLGWTAGDREGDYEIEVSLRNNDTGEVATSSALFRMAPRVTSGAPVVSITANPLVFLYSAPPCGAGSRMRVQFQSPNGLVQTTPSKACDPALSTNIYLAGMRVSTQSSVKHIIDSGSQLTGGPLITLATSDALIPASTYTVLQAPPARVTAGILLQSRFGFPVATDLAGNVVWYYLGDISILGRPEAGGLFLGLLEDASLDTAHQILREFDLAGTTIRETNAARINEQLAAIGKRPITAFHHEARGMPDGRVLALAATEQILTDVQGPGPVDVIGDMILVLDRDFQLLWAWDAFEHLDPYRAAILGETCTSSAGGCPPVRLAAQANDWVHGNSLQLTPDGNILYSARHQDWVIKIDYRNGEGSGDVIWRLGKDGDFQMLLTDPSPWFSHQHDANIQPDDPTILSLFDNGNTRQFTDPSAHSRGQVLQLDEQNRTVRVILNADLGMYSAALGSAQKLDNGNYHFDAGLIAGPPGTSRSMEVDLSGNIVYDIQAAEPLYRSFRMRDLYTATQWHTREAADVPF